MITFLLCFGSSLRPSSITPYWSQDIRVFFFFFRPTTPSTQAEALQGGASDMSWRVQQVAAANGRAPRAAKPRAHIMDGELSGFAWLALASQNPDDQRDS